MLSGSRSQEILNVGLNQLSTYGILKDQGVGFLNSLMRSLTDAGLAQRLAESVRDVTKLRADIESVVVGSLPNDGKVIEDVRTYE